MIATAKLMEDLKFLCSSAHYKNNTLFWFGNWGKTARFRQKNGTVIFRRMQARGRNYYRNLGFTGFGACYPY